MRFFVTGAAGFIGFHLCQRLLGSGHEVHGFDGLTSYYDPQLKNARLERLNNHKGFTFTKGMLEDAPTLTRAAEQAAPDVVVHLAAQAGVRYSIEHPDTYISSNLTGTFNVLELVRSIKPSHFLFASTSSVYGGNTEQPFAESVRADFPVSLYAATKKAGEAMSHSYSHLFGIPTTCFRFFTVYGPWGRPDMALFKFVERIQRGEAIDVYGQGEMSRDFTYVGDLVAGIEKLVEAVPQVGRPVNAPGVRDSLSPVAPWRVVNIAGGTPVGLLQFIEAIEAKMGVKAHRNYMPMQAGDVRATNADPGLFRALTGYEMSVPVHDGVSQFIDWYREYVDGR